MKRCTKCGVEKPVGDFYVDRRAKDGLTPACAECVRATNKRYRHNNPEKSRAQSASWQARHPERVAARQKQYREGPSRERYLAMRKRSREKQREERAAYWAEYYEKNREAVLANRDPGKRRRSRERYRTRKLEAFIEDVRFDEVLLRDSGYCGICDEPIMETTIELDHILPLAAGGMHELVNVQLAHRACNRRKGARLAA